MGIRSAPVADFAALREHVEEQLVALAQLRTGTREKRRLAAEIHELLDQLKRMMPAPPAEQAVSSPAERELRETLEVQQRCHRRLKGLIEAAFDNPMVVLRDLGNLPEIRAIHHPWQMLPAGFLGTDDGRRLLELVCHRRLDPEGTDRLARVREEFGPILGPVEEHLGLQEYRGYVAFRFDQTPKVVFESALPDNATFVAHRDWERLARLTKRELMESGLVSRVIHKDNWLAELTAAMESRNTE